MSNHKPSKLKLSDFKEAGQPSQAAGIADENASYANAGGENAPPSIDEGDPATTDDGSGTRETD